MSKRDRFPQHCFKCPYFGTTDSDFSCDYSYITGKSRVAEKLTIENCTHYLDKFIKFSSDVMQDSNASADATALARRKRGRKKKPLDPQKALEKERQLEEKRERQRKLRDEAKRQKQERIDEAKRILYADMKDLYDQGYDGWQIAEKLNVRIWRVQEWHQETGIPSIQREKKREFSSMLMDLYQKGYSDADMGMMTGLDKGFITRWRERHHLRVNKTPKKEKHEKKP